MHTTCPDPAVLRFGHCELLPHQRELRVDGEAVALGGRAFDLLLVLVEGRGGLLTKDEILSRVWPGVIVEENTLQVQISALRKALGTDRDAVKTISGRGYRFIAEVVTTSAEESASKLATAPGHVPRALTNLPATATEMIGRESELAEILDLMTAHRATKRVIVLLAQEGEIVSWCLMAAADRARAQTLTPVLRDVLRGELEIVCRDAKALADAAIDRASGQVRSGNRL